MHFRENPFYILEVPVTANRREIVAACDDKVLVLGDEVCNEARSILTTPSKRLSAEVRWFPDCSEEVITYIKNGYEGLKKIEDITDELSECSELSQLNAYVAFFESSKSIALSTLKSEILKISRLYESLNISNIRDIINDERKEGGFPQIESTNEILDTVREFRQEIKQIIDVRLSSLTKTSYVRLITSISESYSKGHTKGQAVLEDVISSYCININEALATRKIAIIQMAKFINQSIGKIKVEKAIDDLIEDIYLWSALARPLQFGTKAKGISHEDSRHILNELRSLAISLHNDHQMTDLSLKLTSAMKEVFAELPEDTEKINEDEKTLIQLKNDNELGELLENFINNTVKKLRGYSYSDFQLPDAVDSMLKQVRELDNYIKTNITDVDRCKEARIVLCSAARSVAIDINNERKNYDLSLKIIEFLYEMFDDLPEMYNKLIVDRRTIFLNSHQTAPNRYNSSSYSDTKSAWQEFGQGIIIMLSPIISLIACGVFLFIFGWLFSSCG